MVSAKYLVQNPSDYFSAISGFEFQSAISLMLVRANSSNEKNRRIALVQTPYLGFISAISIFKVSAISLR